MKFTLAMFAAASLVACTDAQRASITSIGSPHHVQLYSGGKLVGEWDSTGAITNEGKSDGFVFVDARTHKNMELSGTIVIIQE